MKISYLKQTNSKLFSFHRHDFQQGEDGTFIDGGFDYTRFNGELDKGEISDLIVDIREQFKWGSIYKKDGKTLRKETKWILLKDLDTDHLIAILIYFTEKLEESISKQWKAYHLFFLYELKYRHNEHLDK